MAKADDDWWCAVCLKDNRIVCTAERVRDVILESRIVLGRRGGIVLMKVKDARKREGVTGLS